VTEKKEVQRRGKGRHQLTRSYMGHTIQPIRGGREEKSKLEKEGETHSTFTWIKGMREGGPLA